MVGVGVPTALSAALGGNPIGLPSVVGPYAPSPVLQPWGHALASVPPWGSGSARVAVFSDSEGQDFIGVNFAAYHRLALRTNGRYATALSYITGTFPWTTVQGVTLDHRGMNGRAQQLGPGQTVQSYPMTCDGVRHRWLADPAGVPGNLALQVDGVTIATEDPTARSFLDTALTRGPHVIGYVNTGGAGTVTVDSPAIYDANRAQGVQFWEMSHSGYIAADFLANPDLPANLVEINPNVVGYQVGINDVSGGSYPAQLVQLVNLVRSILQPGSYAEYVVIPWFSLGNPVPPITLAQPLLSIPGLAVCDMTDVIGSTHRTATYPSCDPLGMTIDGVHLSRAGSALYAAQLSRMLEATLLPLDEFRPVVPVPIAANYTVGSPDLCGQPIVSTAAGAVTVTVPSPSTLAGTPPQPPGGTGVQAFDVVQLGAGKVTFAPGAGGSVLHAVGGLLSIAGQYGRARLVPLSATEWDVTGSPTLVT